MEEKYEDIDLSKDNQKLNESLSTEMAKDVQHPTAASSFTQANLSHLHETEPKQTKFINEFMEVNKEFFEKIGFKDISNDPIFTLANEVEPVRGIKNCSTCTKEITNFFTKAKNCKFCGCPLCDRCAIVKRKFPFSKENKVGIICLKCENKFQNFEIHQEFQELLSKKELEIMEVNQRLEKSSLIFSEQMDEINKLNEANAKLERGTRSKEEIIQQEIGCLKSRITDISSECEKSTLRINENIGYLKKLDETKVAKETELNNIKQDREQIALEYEKKLNMHNEILSKINSLSISIKNFDQNKEKLNPKIRNLSEFRSSDSLHKKTDIEKQEEKEEIILMNPSKSFREVYKEKIEDESSKKADPPKEGKLKSLIMYLGSQFFIKEPKA